MTADTTQPAGALPEPAGQIRLPGAFGLACDGYTADQMRAMMAERDAARRDGAAFAQVCDEADRKLATVEAERDAANEELAGLLDKICAAFEEDDHESPFSRETWDQLEAERDAARARIQHMEAVINDATAEAELAGRREGERLNASVYALRRERDSLSAQVKQLAGAHVAWLAERNELRRDRDLEKKIRKDYVDALEDMRQELEELRAERDRLRIRGAAYEEAYGIAHQATYQSHTGHWDAKGTHGANCPECIRAREARENCDAALKRGLEALIARAATQSPPDAREGREPLTDEQLAVLRFLRGSGNLRGVGFSSAPEGERAPYWWRRELREAFPELDGPVGTSAEGADHA